PVASAPAMTRPVRAGSGDPVRLRPARRSGSGCSSQCLPQSVSPTLPGLDQRRGQPILVERDGVRMARGLDALLLDDPFAQGVVEVHALALAPPEQDSPAAVLRMQDLDVLDDAGDRALDHRLQLAGARMALHQ